MTGTRISALFMAALAMLFTTGCGLGPAERLPTQPIPTQKPGAPPSPPEEGALLFKRFCANCHPDGGNVSDQGRTLHASALRARHITAAADIVRVMRSPASRMIRFDTETVPDREALLIAEYVLSAFR